MTQYEFSNESFNTDYAGMANAYWYGWSLGQWAPVLKGMLPSMQIGANGKPAWNSQGAADVAQTTALCGGSRRRHCSPLTHGTQRLGCRGANPMQGCVHTPWLACRRRLCLTTACSRAC